MTEKKKNRKPMWKKPLLAGILACTLYTAVPLHVSPAAVHAATASPPVLYTVQPGDFLWLIAQKHNITVKQLMEWNHLNSTMIYPGQKLFVVPIHSYTVQPNDFLWKIAQKFGTTITAILEANQLKSDLIYIGQVLKIPVPTVPETNVPQPDEKSGPWVEYMTHIVQRGETGWTIALKYGIPFTELLQVNKLTESSILMPGDRLTIPVHHVPVKPTAGPSYGEYLDWWTEAQYVWPIGTTATVTDFQTGISWKMKRTMGASHADVEPLTAQDTAIMKKVWGGVWSWVSRPVLVSINGHRIAASASAMPHSIDTIKENDFPGHTDIHFANSRRHKDNQVDPAHQRNVNLAAGRQ